MPLNRGCSQAAADANFSKLYGEGYRNPQLSAIVLSTLKKACGVDKDTSSMTVKDILAAGGKSEGRRWVELRDLFEGLPSSPVVRGLSFSLPGGMRGVGTSPSASPPSDTRGLVGRANSPMALKKCPHCGAPYNPSVSNGICPRCRASLEA